MKRFMFAVALLAMGCATEFNVPSGFVVTEVSAAPPPAPPKDVPLNPNVKVEVHANEAASVKVAARSGGACHGVRCKARATVAKLRVFKR